MAACFSINRFSFFSNSVDLLLEQFVIAALSPDNRWVLADWLSNGSWILNSPVNDSLRAIHGTLTSDSKFSEFDSVWLKNPKVFAKKMNSKALTPSIIVDH